MNLTCNMTSTLRVRGTLLRSGLTKWLFSVLKPPLPVSTAHLTRRQLSTPPETSPNHVNSSADGQGLSAATQSRVLSLLTQYRERPDLLRREQLRTIDRARQWVEKGGGHPDPALLNFLFHVCSHQGSSEDIQLAVDLANKYGMEVTDKELNVVLTHLSQNGELAQVKEALGEMRGKDAKIRVGTQTSVLQRAVKERDVPLVLEVVVLLNKDDSFPTSPSVISDALCAWGDVHSCEGVEVVRGVMGLYNNYHQCKTKRHEVDESTAAAFSEWIKGSPQNYSLNKTKVDERGVCMSCGQQLQTNELTQEERGGLLSYFKEEMGQEVGRGRVAQLEREKARELIGLLEERRFGAVVDGLNVATCLRYARRNQDSLLTVSKTLVEKTALEVLVFGRSHITKLLPKHSKDVGTVQRIYDNHGVHLFLLNSRSRDDRYFIYAALAGDSFLVSNDKFGDIAAAMQSGKLRGLFRKWLRGRVVRVTRADQHISLQYPTACERVVQWCEDSWHLPLLTESPQNWLCARASL